MLRKDKIKFLANLRRVRNLYLFVDRHGNGRDPFSMTLALETQVISATGKIITRGPRREESMRMAQLVFMFLVDLQIPPEEIRDLFPESSRIEFREGLDGFEIWYSPYRWLPFIRERGLPDFLPPEIFTARLAVILKVDWIMVLDWDGWMEREGEGTHTYTAYSGGRFEAA